MENIRFSVHIPVYNVEKYLTECVNSVLNQSFENFEIILVDDGSPDNSGRICDSFTDSRIRVYHNENHGVLYSRYFAVMQAKGEYSVFIDSDDYVDSDFLENLDKIFNDENCDIVSFSYKRIFADRVEKPKLPWNEKKVFCGEEADVYRKELLFNMFLNPICTKAIRTSLLKSDNTGFEKLNAKTGEDLLESLYPVFNAKKIVFVPDCWYSYRQNGESVTHSVNPERHKSIIAVREQAYKYFEKSSFFSDENRRRYSNNFVSSMLGCVKLVGASELDYSVKKQSFESISEDEFYGKMLKNFDKSSLDKKTRIIFELFNRKQYKAIVSVCRFGR